tara:strand:- start:292 stop:744 length:453 start_codon:yes stop_codon:yes gene_type:complete
MAVNIAEGQILGKGGGTRLLVTGSMNPQNDLLWTIPYNGNANGGNGVLFIIRWQMNHWNTGSWYKINEGYYYTFGTQTSYQRYGLREVAGTGSASWSNGHLDITLASTGGTSPNSQLLKIQYDADGAPAYGSSYCLDIIYTGTLGAVTIS